MHKHCVTTWQEPRRRRTEKRLLHINGAVRQRCIHQDFTTLEKKLDVLLGWKLIEHLSGHTEPFGTNGIWNPGHVSYLVDFFLSETSKWTSGIRTTAVCQHWQDQSAISQKTFRFYKVSGRLSNSVTARSPIPVFFFRPAPLWLSPGRRTLLC